MSAPRKSRQKTAASKDTGYMSTTSGLLNDRNPGNLAIPSNRKRQSPTNSKLDSDEVPSSSSTSAIHSASSSKQRRIAVGGSGIDESHDSLRNLQDFEQEGVLTRSRARHNASPILNTSNATIDDPSAAPVERQRGKHRKAGTASVVADAADDSEVLPGEKAADSTIDFENPEDAIIPDPRPRMQRSRAQPPRVLDRRTGLVVYQTSRHRVRDRVVDPPTNPFYVQPPHAQMNAADAVRAPVLEEAPGPSGQAREMAAVSHIGIHSAYINSQAVLNQIPVIQNPLHAAGGVPLELQGMLFDPMQGPPGQGQQGRAMSRSAASQFIHGLVPRMQHLLGGHKSMPQDSRVVGIMDGLRSSNELRQAEAAGELAEWLLMANEDSLPSHLPIRDITQALIQLLQMEHNFELMLTAARCIRNLLEAIPRAQPIVVEAVPCLLEKLKRIECVDVAEQALTALEELSKRNSKTILTAGGIAACISHVDFFSIASQRLAFSIASNCATYLGNYEFHLVRDSLSDLTERLNIEDKRCLESVCQLFSRLVENLKNHPDKLREIAGINQRLLALIQQHLVAQPCQLSSSTFSSIIKMLRTLACKCPDIAAALIRMNYHITLRMLFTGSDEPDENAEIVERPPNQLQDMVFLIGELFPSLPTTGIFEIDSVFAKNTQPDAQWYWQDDEQQWQAFRPHDNKTIETVQENGGNQTHDMNIGMHLYHFDLAQMTQKNVQTGKVRPLQRRSNSNKSVPKVSQEEDVRLVLHRNAPDAMEKVANVLFPILVAIDGSSSGPALRFECLRVMLRMICPMATAALRDILADLPLSGHIASALASPRSKDLPIVVAALQMVHLLLEKLSDVYCPLFRKEGVVHEIQKLAGLASKVEIRASSVRSPASPIQVEAGRVTRSQRHRQAAAAANTASSSEDSSRSSKTRRDKETKEPSTSSTRLRKRASPDGSPVSKKEKESRRKSSGFLSALRIPGMGGARTSSSSASGSPTAPSTPPSAQQQAVGNFIAQMVAQSSSSASVNRAEVPAAEVTPLTSGTKEKLRAWIKKEAASLLKAYFSDAGASGDIVDSLSWISEELRKEDEDGGMEPLTKLHDILKQDSVSAFEMMHSGVIPTLHNYLVNPDLKPSHEERLKRFANVFMHLEEDQLRPSSGDDCFKSFETLVAKVNASVAQLEQFQVKVNDMGGIVTGSSGCLRGAQALRFFQNHQIKCFLRRHPNCHDLKDYHRHGGSTIKVDPFTSISAIERYLVDKELARPRAPEEETSGEEMSDDDEQVLSAGNGTEERRIEILINDNPLPSQMSVLQALRQYAPYMNNGDENQSVGSSLWMTTHTLFYRSAPEGSQQAAANTTAAVPAKEKKRRVNDKLWNDGEVQEADQPLFHFLQQEMPCEIEDPSVPALLLLRALHGLNRFWYNLFDTDKLPPTTFAPILPISTFHSSKLAAKMQRQLSDFISVATQQLPQWTTNLANAMPFLFPFSLRRSLLYCTSFGRDRALIHLVSQTEGAHGDGESGRLNPRLERRKIVVKRDDLLRSAESALANNASARAVLEVSFEGEAGTGFGPTLEFYSTVSRELQNAIHKMWSGATQSEQCGDEQVDYVVAGHGLYPAAQPLSHRKDNAKLKKFETLGRLMGQALVDSRMLDLPLSSVFLQWIVAEPGPIGVAQLELLDPQLYQSLRQLALTGSEDFECLEQYFTLPGNEAFELMKNGRNIAVSKDNVHKYIKLVSWWRLVEGVWREMDAVKRGFAQVVDPAHLSFFLPEELDQLFCGCSDGGERIWGEQALVHAIKPDHGYTHDSEQIRWLIYMLSTSSVEEQRKFVQFVTGSPRLPVGGFRALTPALTVVRKTTSYGSGDEELPSAMTCYNYLKVPAYSSYEVLRERFEVALQFAYSFHLT